MNPFAPEAPRNLQRSMKRMGVLLLTLSSITPAASIFIAAPNVVQQAGTGGAVSFLIAAAISLLVAFAYAELASAYPLTGGEYAVVARILGPLPGFVILGLNIATMIFIEAIVALGLGDYLGVLIPGLPSIGVGIACVVLTTFCGIMNLRTNAVVTGLFLAVEIIAVLALTLLGLVHIERPLTELLLHPLHQAAAGGLEPVTLGAIGLATVVATFAYNGYGNAIYLGEEMHEAPQHLGRVIVASLLIVILAEAAPVTAMLVGAPDLEALFSSQHMISDFIEARGGSTMNTLISLGIACAIINASIATILLLARQIYSTGRDRVWTRGINRALMRLHPRFHSPWVATLVTGALASAACFIGMNRLLVITGTGIVFVYASLCVAVIVGRQNGKTAHGIYRMPWYPLPPLFGLAAMIYIIYASYLDPDIGRPSLWATGGMIVLAAGYYLFILRRRGTWVPRGPEAG